MITMKIDSSELSSLKSKISNLRRDQLPYAYARALTATARDVQRAMPEVLDRTLERPTPFTRNGMFVTAATKIELAALVGFKDIQARYLAAIIKGTTRTEKPSEQKFLGRYFVPASGLTKNVYGNVPKNTLVAILRAAVDGTAYKGGRVFVLATATAKHAAGVYLAKRRTTKKASSQQLTPLLFFVAQAPRYKRLLDFPREVHAIVNARFGSNFRAAYAAAVGSAL